MMKRLIVPATVTIALATLAFAGCGGSTSSKGDNGTGADAGNTGTSPSDSGSSTLPSDGAAPHDTGASQGSDDSGMAQGNPPLPDGSVLPSGNQLVPVTDPSSYIVLNGVTSDDYAIYTLYTATTSTAYAISLAAGSKPISLGAVDSSDPVTVIGKVVFIGTSAPDQLGAGAASVWTSGAAAASPLSSSTVVSLQGGAGEGLFAVSADGAHVLFLDGIDANDTTASIAIAGPDGSGKATVVPSVSLADVCFPQLAMAGTTTTYAVATYCETGGDAGSEDASAPEGGTNVNIGTVSSFAAPNWTSATIVSNVQTVFSVDKGGTTVVVNGPFGTAAYPIAGGNQVLIDATGEVGAATLNPGILTNAGANLLYTTTAQALMKGTTGSVTTPVQLVGSGFSAVYGVSPDENWLVGTLNQDQQGATTDLWFASAAQAGPATALSQATTGALSGQAFGGPVVGDLFTADSLHVLFQTAADQGPGTLNAASVTAPGTAVALGSSALYDFGTSAGKVVFNANFNGNTNEGGGSADVLGVDTAGTAAATVLVTAADPAFFLNSEKTTVVYSWSYEPGTSSAGLWALAAP